jgi:mono/diheme cytochrome c family protein
MLLDKRELLTSSIRRDRHVLDVTDLTNCLNNRALCSVRAMIQKRTVVALAMATLSFNTMSCAVETAHETSTQAVKGGVRFLDQGWDDATRAAFYQTPQGSRMLPYAWWLELEQADSHKKLRAAANLREMGFLVDGASATNPDGLPVGFARDTHPTRGDSLGLTCAACHTGQIRYRGIEIRIDGGQSLGDLEALQNAIHDSLDVTLADTNKFKRFANAVLGGNASSQQRAALRTQMIPVRDWWAGRISRSKGTSPHGPSRIDAFTVIGNEVVCALFQDPRNCEAGVAPTQMPHLWGTPDFEWVQYNSSVHSPLGRNVGQVTGVFAEASFDANGLNSTANLTNLHRLENWLKTLQAPQWPEQYLPAIDDALAAQGEELYANACASCHPVTAPRTAPNAFGLTFAQVNSTTPLNVLGTDPSAAMKFATRRAYPGPFTAVATAQGLVGPDGKAPVAALLAISGSMITQRFFATNGFTDAQKIDYLGYRESRSASTAQLTTYKARPLDGIAFTAPFLHNGSVPSIYELLLPPAQRSTQFWVGSDEFDPIKLGYSTTCSEGAMLFDTTLAGNGNGGHVYGTDLSESDRLALVEYIKTL